MVESDDNHALGLHPPLSEVPLFANPVVEREQLSCVSEPVRERILTTHIAVRLEVCDVPQDTLGEFPD